MIEERATRPVINVLCAAFDGASVGICDSNGVRVGFCDGTWVGICGCDGARVGFFDGALDGGQLLVPHEAPEQKAIYEVKSLSHLQRFWSNEDAPLNM